MKITESELLLILEEVFEKDSVEMKVEDSFKDYDEWDSLTQLSLVATLDDEFDININSDELEKINTIQDILNLITNS
jgi:acyl carrier protein